MNATNHNPNPYFITIKSETKNKSKEKCSTCDVTIITLNWIAFFDAFIYNTNVTCMSEMLIKLSGYKMCIELD